MVGLSGRIGWQRTKSYGAYYIGHILWQQYRLRKKSVGLKLPVVSSARRDLGEVTLATRLSRWRGAGLIRVRNFETNRRKLP